VARLRHLAQDADGGAACGSIGEAGADA
jgi:hypothetical protein